MWLRSVKIFNWLMCIISALTILSQPENVPAMINCAHGKDRTGIISALVLACLGATTEEIVADYSRSEVRLQIITSL